MASLNPALRTFWRKKARNRVLYGGRSSSKSHDAAGMAIIIASQCKVRILCTRHFQNKIEESVYSLLKQKIEAFNLQDQFNITNNSIICTETGSEFLFYGIARNIDQIKSTEGVDILWMEEAHLVSKSQWEILEPTIRKEGSQVWVIFNPRFASDFVYQRFVVNPPPNSIVQKINYTDNPFLSQTMLDIIENAKAEDQDDYEHVYLGVPRLDDDQVIIKRSWIEAAIDAHIKLGFEPQGKKVIGFDVADDGGDLNANIYAHGSVVLWGEEWKGLEDQLLKSCKRTYSNAKNYESTVKYDSIGVGAFAGSKFDEMNKEPDNDFKLDYAQFNAGSAVLWPERFYAKSEGGKIKNKDFFSNLKAQTWWNVADRFRNTYDAINNGTVYESDELISISSEFPAHLIEKLKTELSTPKRDFDNNGRVKVESKKDLAKREVVSPNCFIAGTLIKTKRGNIPIEQIQIGDLIATPMGYEKVIFTHENYVDEVITKYGLTGTPEHKVFTWNKGWVSMQMLSSCDTIETYNKGFLKWRIMNLFYIWAKCSQFSTQVNTIVQDGMVERTLVMSDFYTGAFGSITTARFLKDVTSIISTAIGAITTLKTCSALTLKNMAKSICLSGINVMNIGRKINLFLMPLGKKQANGISQKKVELGIQNMRDSKQVDVSISNILAQSANKILCLGKTQYQAHAHGHAQLNKPMLEQKLPVNRHVNVVELHSLIQNEEAMSQSADAPENARNTSKVVKVYNLTLERHNVYYANDVLVRNCADAFVMCYAPINKAKSFFG